MGSGQHRLLLKDGALAFNTLPVLVREMNARANASNPIIAGPKSRPLPQQSPAGNPNPWAQWQGPRLSSTAPTSISAARQPTGPIEAKFASQEQKLQQLERSMQQLAEGQKQQQGAILQIRQDTVNLEKSTKTYIDASLQTFRSDIDQH